MGKTASKTKNALEDDRAEELANEIRADESAVIRLTDGQAPSRMLRLGTLALNIKDQEGSEQVTEGLKSVWNFETGGDECMRADDETKVSLNVEEGQFQSEMYKGGTTESQILEQKQKALLRETMRADDETLTSLSEHEGLELSGTNASEAGEMGAFIQKQDGSRNLVRGAPGAEEDEEEEEEMKKKLDQLASQNGVHDDDIENSDKENSTVSPPPPAAAEETSKIEDTENDDKQANKNLMDKNPDEDFTQKTNSPGAGPSGSSGDRKKRQISEQCSTTLSDISELDQEDDFPTDSPASLAPVNNTEEGSQDCLSSDAAETMMVGGSEHDSNKDDNEDKEGLPTTESESEITDDTSKKPVKESIMASSFKEFLGMFKIHKKSEGQDSIDQEESLQSENSVDESIDAENSAKEENGQQNEVKSLKCNENVIARVIGFQARGGELKDQMGAGNMLAIGCLPAAVRTFQLHQDNSEAGENLIARAKGNIMENADQDLSSVGAQEQDGSALEDEKLQKESGHGKVASNTDAAELGGGKKGTQEMEDVQNVSGGTLKGNQDGRSANKTEDESKEGNKSGTQCIQARNGDGNVQNTTEEQENLLNGMKSAEDDLERLASLKKSLDGNDIVKTNGESDSPESTSQMKSMKRMPSVDRGEETIIETKTLKLKLCGKVMSVQEDNEGSEQPRSPNEETTIDDKGTVVSSNGSRLLRMSASSAEDSGIGSIAAGSPTEAGDTDGKGSDTSSQEGTGLCDGKDHSLGASTENQIKNKNEASLQSEVLKTSEAIAMDCKAAPKTGFKCPDSESGNGVSIENKMTSKDENVIKSVNLETSEANTLDCKAAPKIGFKYPDNLDNQSESIGSNIENQINSKDKNVIKPEDLKTSEAIASECKAGPKTGFKYTDSLDSDNDLISREISIDSETAMGDVESMASLDLSRRDSIDSEAELRSFEQDESITEMESGDLIDDLGIMYDDTAEWGVAETSLEMRQDDRGVMMSDDEESDDEVFIDEGISSSQSQDAKRKGSQSKDGHTSKSRKVKFRSKNITVGWKAMKLLSSECVPDGEGLEGKLKESAVKMTKLLQDAEQAHSADSPDVEGAQAKVTLQAYGLKIGDKVMVGGVKTGVLRFCGPTEFASGIWAGIELDEAAGKNDGSVGGVSYFKCSPKHGIFAPVSKISRPGILTNRGGNTPRKAVNYAHVDTSKVTAKVDTGLHRARSARSASSMPAEENLLDAGERVLVAGQRRGVIRFSGEADFAPGWWYGIELDRPVGKNDGSVNGKRYFTCKPKYGVFAPPSRIQKLSDLPDAGECLEAVAERQKRLTGGTGTGSQPALNTSSSKARPGPTRQEGYLEASKIPTTPRRSLPKSSGSAGMRRPPPLSTNTGGEFRLQEGTSVFCNNELGVIRFMGSVEFAEGIWLGVELRTSKGKNDGSVGGTRYFTCRPNHGLLVRPSKVTVRGINGAKLMGNLEASDSDKKDMSY